MVGKWVIGLALVLLLGSLGEVLSRKQINGYYENWSDAITPGTNVVKNKKNVLELKNYHECLNNECFAIFWEKAIRKILQIC